jgi:hypothetical protein
MKVFVCCEGITDGDVLRCFIRKCSDIPDIEIHYETHSSIKSKKTYSVKKFNKYLDEQDQDTKFDRLAYMTKLFGLAALEGGNHIAYHQDAGHQGFEKVYDGVAKDFSSAVPSDVKYLAIVPKEMIESWLLADEKAYPSIPVAPKLPARPEKQWGDRRNPDSGYPKNYFKRVLSQFGLEATRDVYADIAAKSDITTLKNRRLLSFERFVNDMRIFTK